MPEHLCYECGTTFNHYECDHPEGEGVELYCHACAPSAFSSWSSDETGMEEEDSDY